MPKNTKTEAFVSIKSFFAPVLWIISSFRIVTSQALFVLKWNKRLKEFEPIFGVDYLQEKKRQNALQRIQEENYNFNGQDLRITYFEDPAIFNIYDNGTKATGACGDIWTILSNYLNFTIVLDVKKEKFVGYVPTPGNYTGILRIASLNQTDVIPKLAGFGSRLGAVKFSPALWITGQRIFARARWNPNSDWMFDVFNVTIWYNIFIFVTVFSMASFVTEQISILPRHRKRQARPLPVHLFYTLSTLFNQGNTTDNTRSGSRILKLTIGMFCWFVLASYNSCLIISLKQEVFHAPFDDLETLLENTELQVLVVNGSLSKIVFSHPGAQEIFRRIAKAGRVSVAKSLDDLYEKVCFQPNKYVLFDEEDAVAIRKNAKCKLYPMGPNYYEVHMIAGTSRALKGTKKLHIGIMKLQEFGIINTIKNHYMPDLHKARPSRKQIDSLVIDADRVYVIFGILCVGIVASIAICILENIVFTLSKRK